VPHQGTGDSGGGGDPQTVKVYAWNKSTPHLWRAGHNKADPGAEGRNADCHRDSGTCHGSYEKKDYSLRSHSHGDYG
jgi:hypothetical protein